MDTSLVSPDGPSLDNYYLARPGAHEVQLDLFLDYASNVALYPKFQSYFRTSKPPLLAVWGRNDPYFVPAERKHSSGISQTRKSNFLIPVTSQIAQRLPDY